MQLYKLYSLSKRASQLQNTPLRLIISQFEGDEQMMSHYILNSSIRDKMGMVLLFNLEEAQLQALQ